MLRAGNKVGPYTLIKELGMGGFGIVWLAEKRTIFATHKVALKIALEDKINLEAIKREASLWEQANYHPNVLPIFDADVYDGHLVAIATQFAPDGSLDNWLNKHHGKAPSIESAVEMALGILAGLEHLHSLNIIHRDLKPANILLQGETPRLADFGLARLLKPGSHSMERAGTFPYMAPEAIDGERSRQTDVWSAGIVFYQLLDGRLPFPQKDIASLLVAITTSNPDPLPSSVPEQLQKIIASSLQKDLVQRFKSATEMRLQLREAWRTLTLTIVDSPPSKARSSPAQTSGEETPSMDQTLVLPVFSGAQETDSVSPLITRDLANVYAAALKHYEDGRWHEALADLRRIQQIDENYRDVAKLIEDCQRRIEQNRIPATLVEEAKTIATQSTDDKEPSGTDLAGAGVHSESNLLSRQDDTLLQKKKTRRGLILGVSALLICVVLVAAVIAIIRSRQAEAIKASEQQYKAGIDFLSEGKAAEAEVALKEAIRLNPNDPRARIKLGEALESQNKHAEAEAQIRQHIQLNPNDADAHDALGIVLAKQHKYADAEAEHRQAIRLNPNSFLSHNNLGVTLRDQRRYGEAEAEYREAIRLNPKYDYAHSNLGEILFFQKRYAEAEVEYREAIRLNPYYARPHFALGNVLSLRRDYVAAEAEYREAIRLAPNSGYYQSGLGELLLFQKRFAEAEAQFKEAIYLDPTNASARSDLAGALGSQKKYAEAEIEIREALRLEPNNARSHARLGALLYFQHKYAEAKLAYEEAVRLEPSNVQYQRLFKMVQGRGN